MTDHYLARNVRVRLERNTGDHRTNRTREQAALRSVMLPIPYTHSLPRGYRHRDPDKTCRTLSHQTDSRVQLPIAVKTTHVLSIGINNSQQLQSRTTCIYTHPRGKVIQTTLTVVENVTNIGTRLFRTSSGKRTNKQFKPILLLGRRLPGSAQCYE